MDKELAKKFENYPQSIPRLSVDGPYGSPADDVFNYDGVVLIGAGIGGTIFQKWFPVILIFSPFLVTPYAAILKHIRSSQANNIRLHRVYFYWICNTTSCYEWFAQMLQELERELGNQADFLTYNIYLTQWSMTQARAVVRHNTDQCDIWTGLQSKTQYGRPNFDADFQSIINEDWKTKTKRDIGVFVCGPKPLVKQLQRLCIQLNDSNASKNNTQFYLNKENF